MSQGDARRMIAFIRNSGYDSTQPISPPKDSAMNDQLSKQADAFRQEFIARGLAVSDTPTNGGIVEATVPSSRNISVVALIEDAASNRFDIVFLKNAQEIYRCTINPAATAERDTANVLKAIAFDVINDHASSNDEIEKAVSLVRKIENQGKVGFMHDKTETAVLAEAVLRLMERVKQLEAKS